jgi:hypothetical protein
VYIFLCFIIHRPWANSSIINKYVYSFLTNSNTPVKIAPTVWFDKYFVSWLRLYISNCNRYSQAKNSNSLFTLSNYSKLCMEQLLEQVKINI